MQSQFSLCPDAIKARVPVAQPSSILEHLARLGRCTVLCAVLLLCWALHATFFFGLCSTAAACASCVTKITVQFAKQTRQAKSEPYGIKTGACRRNWKQPKAKHMFSLQGTCRHGAIRFQDTTLLSLTAQVLLASHFGAMQ